MPAIGVFQRKGVSIGSILPLATAMMVTVILMNASLAFSSIQFYQIARVLVTPTVALLNGMILRKTIPSLASLALIPLCAGVGVVTYFDTSADVPASISSSTGMVGVLFALGAVVASALYAVWIKKYELVLGLSDFQLLLNMAPVSVLMMLYIIPFSDDLTVWRAVSWSSWATVMLVRICEAAEEFELRTDLVQSSILAALVNISQFTIISEAGPVSLAVISQFKACAIFVLGWVHEGNALKAESWVGVAMAMAGIILWVLSCSLFILRSQADHSRYTAVMHRSET